MNTNHEKPADEAVSLVSAYDQPWLTSLLRPVLIVALVACYDAAIITFLRRVAPEMPTSYARALMFGGILAAAIGCITTMVLAQPSRRWQRNFTYRSAELGVLLAIARLAIWAVAGLPAPDVMFVRPFDALFDLPFVVTALVITTSWSIATGMANDLNQLALQPDEMLFAMQTSDRSAENMRAAAIDRRAILQRIVGRWIGVGLLLILLAASARRELSTTGLLLILRQDVEPGAVLAVIVYFLMGLLLIGQAQLALLRARWTLDRTPGAAAILASWPAALVGVVLAAALIAALMPFGSTFYLARILAAIVTAAAMIGFTLYRMLIVGLLWLLSLFAGDAGPLPSQPTPPPPPPIDQPAPEMAPLLPDWAGGALFWTFMALLMGYAALVYFRDRGMNLGWLHWLWQALRQRWGTWSRGMRVRRKLAREEAAAASSRGRAGALFDWLTVRWRDPDQQARFYYLSSLHAAEEHGVPRRPGETPLVFAPRLRHALASELDEPPAIEELTETFVKVRYAGDHVDTARATTLRQIWQKLRHALQARSM